MSQFVFFPKPCLFSTHIPGSSSNSHHMNPLLLWNHGVMERIKNISNSSGDENRPGSWNLIFLRCSVNSNLFLHCVSIYSTQNVIWILINNSHKKLTTSWTSVCLLCRRMMNKNNWSNKFFNGNKGSPGKGKNPLRSPGGGKGQENFKKHASAGQNKEKPPKEKKNKMTGLSEQEFKGAIDFGEEDEAMDPSDGLPNDDQMLLSTTGAIQRLWQLHLTDARDRKMGHLLISNIALPCSDMEFNTIVVLIMKVLNLPDHSIKGPVVRTARENILPATRLSANFTEQEADRGWTILPLPYEVLVEAMGKGDESGGMTHHQRFWLLDEVQINNDPKNSRRRVAQKDPVALQLVPEYFADVARPNWSEVLILRGVMSDSPGAGANTVLALLHSHVTRGKIDGLRPGCQIWPVVLAFPNKNPDKQSKAI